MRKLLLQKKRTYLQKYLANCFKEGKRKRIRLKPKGKLPIIMVKAAKPRMMKQLQSHTQSPYLDCYSFLSR